MFTEDVGSSSLSDCKGKCTNQNICVTEKYCNASFNDKNQA